MNAMSTPEERLDELGLSVPEVATPVAVYIPAVRSGNHVFTSGQLPMRDGELMMTGKVGGEVSQEDAVECARQCGLNAIAAVKAEVGDLSAVKRVVKVVVFVASTPDFTGAATGGQRRLRAARRGLRRRRSTCPLGRRRARAPPRRARRGRDARRGLTS